MKRIATEFTEEGGIEVVVRMSYSTWCCNGTHELADAAKAVERLFSKYDNELYDPATDPDERRWHEENTEEDT